MGLNFNKIFASTVVATLAMAPLTVSAANWMQSGAIEQATNNQEPFFIQSNDAQMTFESDQLREQVRNLNGRVEELTFQLLQMQEQLRKMQEDNEFRFQELEEKQSSLTGNENRDVAVTKKLDTEKTLGKSQPSERETLRLDGKTTDTTSEISSKTLDRLGSLIFDKDGNLVKGSLNKPPEHQNRGDLGDYSELLVQILAKDDPVILYKFGRDQIQFGDYILAAETFDVFLKKYGQNKLAESALFWLGESYLLQEKFEQSAKMFVKHHREFPNSSLAATNLLNLGISLAGLDQRQVACATFAEVRTQYPDAKPMVLRKLKREQKGANCL